MRDHFTLHDGDIIYPASSKGQFTPEVGLSPKPGYGIVNVRVSNETTGEDGGKFVYITLSPLRSTQLVYVVNPQDLPSQYQSHLRKTTVSSDTSATYERASPYTSEELAAAWRRANKLSERIEKDYQRRINSKQIAERYLLIALCLAVVIALGGVGYGVFNYFSHLPSSNTATLYQENGSDNWQGWKGSSDWKVANNTLTNDGSNNNWNSPTIVAPVQISGANYAVEAKIQGESFGISVRGSGDSNNWNGYWVFFGGTSYMGTPHALIQDSNGIGFWNSILAQTAFDPNNALHTYRVEVRGDTIRLFVDNNFLVEAHNNDFPTGGQVGLGSDTPLTVSSFNVYAI